MADRVRPRWGADLCKRRLRRIWPLGAGLLLLARVQGRARAGHVLLEEYEEGDFYRAFQIHESIDSTHIEAECKNGVLTVHLPKTESARPRKVSVRGE